MYKHFNEFDPSITDDQNTQLQTKFPGKLGNISLGELLLDERDNNGDAMEAPEGRLQGYLAGKTFERGDILMPAISPEISWEQALVEISQHSQTHPHLTLAFEGSAHRYRVAYLGPIQSNAKPIDIEKITPEDLAKLRFFGGRAYIIE